MAVFETICAIFTDNTDTSLPLHLQSSEQHRQVVLKACGAFHRLLIDEYLSFSNKRYIRDLSPLLFGKIHKLLHWFLLWNTYRRMNLVWEFIVTAWPVLYSCISRFRIGNKVVDFFKTIMDENCVKPGVWNNYLASSWMKILQLVWAM